MSIYINTASQIKGGPLVWSKRFCQQLEKRGYHVTVDIKAQWEAALFVNLTEGLEDALGRGKPLAYRVAGAYLPGWFDATGQTMKPEHHAANASIARALDMAKVVIYQSEYSKIELDTNLYHRTSDFQVIYNGVDLNQFSPASIPPDSPPVIGTVGSLRHRYRLETLFEMSRKLDIPHRLLIVGNMDEECTAILNRAKGDPGLGERVTYQSQVPAQDLPKYYRLMSLLVHPVCGDWCPNVVVEALACGLPVVTPRYGGTVELVGEAGGIFDCRPWVYDQNFINSLSESTREAIIHRQSLSEQARKRAYAILDIERMVDKYLAALGLPPYSPESEKRVIKIDWRSRLRQTGARWIARPRYYSALAIRKARLLNRRLLPVRQNPKPRIAFSLFDFHIGGIENWLYRLAKNLQQSYDFYFLATRTVDFSPKFQEVGKTAYLPNPASMITYLQKHNIDILQVHNERWPVDAGLAAGVPHIIERLGGQRSWRRVPKFGLDMVVASSQMAVSAVEEMISPEKIRLIYNGIDVNEIDASPVMRLFPSDTLIIGRTSRFGVGQNLGLLIEAVSRLLSTIPHLRLVLVGGDSRVPGAQPVEQDLHRMTANMGLDQAVLFTGLVENSIPYVKGFDIGTCVSNDEGIPNSLIEAMACHKPVISTKVGAIPELIEDEVNGLLIPPNDLDALCNAITRLVTNPQFRQRLAEQGRRTIEEKFSMDTASRKYVEIYDALLGRHP